MGKMGSFSNEPTRPPLYKIGGMIMGFAEHYPVAGKIKDMKWHLVNLEWEYFVENDDGFDGKLKESKVAGFDQDIWKKVKSMWDEHLRLMKEASILELSCRKLLSDAIK